MTHRTGPRRGAALGTALALLGALLTGCGGDAEPRVASVGPTSTASPSPTAERAGALAYSRCMRRHGIKDFPDPGPDGEISLKATPGSDLAGPKFDAANEACKSLMPRQGQGKDPSVVRAATLKYAKCMRAHGIARFPDPGKDGGIQVSAGPGLDPDSPRFRAADKACQHLLPGGGGGRSNHDDGGGGR